MSSSLFLLQSNSFSTAQIKSDLTFKIATDGDNALIGVTNKGEKSILIINNTENTIVIDRVELLELTETDGLVEVLPSISPGETTEIPLIGKSDNLSNKIIQVSASWHGGEAVVQSILPTFDYDVTIEGIKKETEEKSKEVPRDLAGEKPITDIIEEITTPDIVTPIQNESQGEIKELKVIDTELTTDPVIIEEVEPIAEEDTVE